MFDIQTKIELGRGNPQAFKKVFQLLYPRLKSYCKLFIKDDYQIDDIIQDTFIALWEKKNKIDPDKQIESFVFVIVRNKCLNFLKAQHLEYGKIQLDNLETNELQYLYQLDFMQKEEKSIEEMMIKSFQQAINDLPEKMKAVFLQCKIEGKKQKQVAAELGISLKMVEKHIAGAKLQIREKLLKQYPALAVLITLLLK